MFDKLSYIDNCIYNTVGFLYVCSGGRRDMDYHSEDDLVSYTGETQKETFCNLKRQNHIWENVI